LRAARIAVSNSYSPEVAAIALDFLKREGLYVVHELIFLNCKAYRWAICALPAQALSARDVV
jgi:hypothetical protein